MYVTLVHEELISSQQGSTWTVFAKINLILPSLTLMHHSIEPSSSTLVTTAQPHALLNGIPFKCLIPVELHSRRERGLCYNCEEKLSPSHKFKALP